MKSENSSPAYKKFVNSMQITSDQGRDGIGFDLDTLEQVSETERENLTRMLTERLDEYGDWREMDALMLIGTPAAKDAVRRASTSPNLETQLHAAKKLAEAGDPVDLEGIIIVTLRNTDRSSGLSQAIHLAEQYPSPRLQEALLDLALNGSEEQRIHCAALALYHGGKAESPFDWDHRPFFLRFGDDDRQVQIDAYKELCQRLGIQPKLP